MSKKRILGIAASLRNARWGAGNEELIEALNGISSKEELFSYLKEQSELHLENFVEAEQFTKRNVLKDPCNLKYKLQHAYILQKKCKFYY